MKVIVYFFKNDDTQSKKVHKSTDFQLNFKAIN